MFILLSRVEEVRPGRAGAEAETGGRPLGPPCDPVGRVGGHAAAGYAELEQM